MHIERYIYIYIHMCVRTWGKWDNWGNWDKGASEATGATGASGAVGPSGASGASRTGRLPFPIPDTLSLSLSLSLALSLSLYIYIYRDINLAAVGLQTFAGDPPGPAQVYCQAREAASEACKAEAEPWELTEVLWTCDTCTCICAYTSHTLIEWPALGPTSRWLCFL